MKATGKGAIALAMSMTFLFLSACAGGTAGKTDSETVTETAGMTETKETEVGPDMEEITPKVKIENGKFTVGGRELFINGVNTPWENWNDFGGNYSAAFWSSHFRDLHEIGVNASRVWINCNSTVGIKLRADGTVGMVTEKHWQDVDSLFKIAKKNKIYL